MLVDRGRPAVRVIRSVRLLRRFNRGFALAGRSRMTLRMKDLSIRFTSGAGGGRRWIGSGGSTLSLERNQDDEWNLRLQRAGGRVWQDPGIRSWYSVRPSLSALARQYFYYGLWKVAVIRKHGKPASWRHLAPGLFLLLNVALLLWRPWMALMVFAPYVVMSLGFSVAAASRSDWLLLPMLPLVFAVYHFSYGIGFLWGCVRAIV